MIPYSNMKVGFAPQNVHSNIKKIFNLHVSQSIMLKLLQVSVAYRTLQRPIGKIHVF